MRQSGMMMLGAVLAIGIALAQEGGHGGAPIEHKPAAPHPAAHKPPAQIPPAQKSAAHGSGTHWSYEGKGGPDHWGDLSPDYAVCSHGRQQSPIDIAHTDKAPLANLKIHWLRGEYKIVNNGHSIQVTAPAGGMLMVGDKSYYLLQLHFHTPSEHTYLGRSLPMEVHFVHREHGGNALAVIGVFMDTDGYNKAFADIMAHAPAAGGAPVAMIFDPSALLPASTAYWNYQGSLTTPPCSEIVNWIVLKEMVSVDKESARIFRSLYPMNARPIQPIDGREILSAH